MFIFKNKKNNQQFNNQNFQATNNNIFFPSSANHPCLKNNLIFQSNRYQLIDDTNLPYFDLISALSGNILNFNDNLQTTFFDKNISTTFPEEFIKNHYSALEHGQKILSLYPNNLYKIILFSDEYSAFKAALSLSISQSKSKKNNLIIQEKTSKNNDSTQIIFPYPDTSLGNKTQEEIEFELLREIENYLQKNYKQTGSICYSPLINIDKKILKTSLDFHKKIKTLTEKFELLLISDERKTFPGRTGAITVSEKTDVFPQIICLGRTTTNGITNYGALLIHKSLDNFLPNLSKILNVPNAINSFSLYLGTLTVSTLTSQKFMEQLQEKIYILIKCLKELRSSGQVSSIKQEGLTLGITLNNNAYETADKLFNEKIICPFYENDLLIMPSLNIENSSLKSLLDKINHSIICPTL